MYCVLSLIYSNISLEHLFNIIHDSFCLTGDVRMDSQISTAISDGLLALTTLHAVYKVFIFSYMASLGFLIIAVAACLGTVYFTQQTPSNKLISWHKYITWLASVAGLPFVSCGYCHLGNGTILSNALLAGCLAVLLLQKQLAPEVKAMCGDIMGAFGLVVIAIVSMAGGNSYGIIGVVLYVACRAAMKLNLQLTGIKTVDLFHFALMFGNIALMFGLTKEEKPIFYRGT